MSLIETNKQTKPYKRGTKDKLTIKIINMPPLLSLKSSISSFNLRGVFGVKV